MTGPDLSDLLGDDVPPEDRARIERVHRMLLEAGPPPELPPALDVLEPEQNVFPLFPRRRVAASVVLAAAFALAAFGAGYLVGGRDDAAAPERTLTMAAPAGAASAARATLVLFPVDDAGNWPMRLSVTDLRPLAEGETYELWLTQGDELVEPCGTFRTLPDGTASVELNAPYRLKQFDGWVVTRAGDDAPVLTT